MLKRIDETHAERLQRVALLVVTKTGVHHNLLIACMLQGYCIESLQTKFHFGLLTEVVYDLTLGESIPYGRSGHTS